MINRDGSGRLPFDRRGYTLFECALGLSISVILVVLVACSFRSSLDAARASRVLLEMRSILQAARSYYDSKGVWPVNMLDVKSFLLKSPLENAWGHVYQLSPQGMRFQVDTEVPDSISLPVGEWGMVTESRMVNGKRWQMSVPLSYGRAARLKYEE